MIRVSFVNALKNTHTSRHRAGVFALANSIPDSQEMYYDANGRPYINEGYVSVAHTQGVAIAAHAPSPVGVDIESADRVIEGSTIKYLLSKRELSLMHNTPLVNAWVVKEAALKLKGVGVTGPLSDSPMILKAEGSTYYCRYDDSTSIWVRLYTKGTYIIAVAYENSKEPVSIY